MLDVVVKLCDACRLLPAASPYFSFSSLAYAASPEPGLVAPGMHVTLTVTFTPTSLHDLDDVMVLETEQGSLKVPLLARRDPPLLSLQERIAVVPTLVGNQQVSQLCPAISKAVGKLHINRHPLPIGLKLASDGKCLGGTDCLLRQ